MLFESPLKKEYSLADWNQLRFTTPSALVRMGCRQRRPHSSLGDDSGYVLILFPGEWYPKIPLGLIVDGVRGDKLPFKKTTHPCCPVHQEHLDFGILVEE